jgi:hypothetical protein
MGKSRGGVRSRSARQMRRWRESATRYLALGWSGPGGQAAAMDVGDELMDEGV